MKIEQKIQVAWMFCFVLFFSFVAEVVFFLVFLKEARLLLTKKSI